MSQIITAADFRRLLQSGANNLLNQCQYIDSLNVFPVPDGDTGTNMNLTFNAGVQDCLKAQDVGISELTRILSKGLLLGARGNSGVILSQIFRGFAQSLNDQEEITLREFAAALVNGSKAAYKAVMRPVEGTILTVIRESSEQAEKLLTDQPELDLVGFLQALVEYARTSLANTPNLLPVLKEVGVVDSGGTGLLVILEGFLAAAQGEIISLQQEKPLEVNTPILLAQQEDYGYCTEAIIQLTSPYKDHNNETKLMELLAQIGDSVVVVQDDDIIKVHVHSFQPGDILNICQRYGEFLKLKIENMQQQHDNLTDGVFQNQQGKKKKYALIAVANGEGVIAAFKELQVDFIITGGQTMNPATEDFVAAIQKANAENIIILPNNPNIILAANQAATAFSDSNIEVIRTKAIPQGLSACIVFDASLSLKENVKAMKEAYKRTLCASVTYAIKDSRINGLNIKANDYMGILDKEIVSCAPDKVQVAQDLLKRMVNEKTEILTVISGADITAEELHQLVTYISSELKVEYELVEGQQPVYSFIFGVQ